MIRRLILLCIGVLCGCAAVGLLAQSTGVPTNLHVSTDASGYLNVTATGAGSGQGQQGVFTNLVLATDSSGYLKINCQAGCSGGGGTPGGSTTQVQYNNAGAFGGITGATTDGTALTLVAPILGTPLALVLTNATGLVTAGINASQVTLAKIQNAGSNSVLVGSGAAGTGSPYVELTLGTNLSMSGTTLNASSGSSPFLPAYVSKTAIYTLVNGTDGTVECLTNAFTLTLPTAVGQSGKGFIVKNAQTANTCTVGTTSSQTIDGASTVGVVASAIGFISDGANWRQVFSFGLTVPSLAQGDTLYASAANVLTNLAKSSATFAVMGNGGTSNNPAWSATIPIPVEFNLPTGVSQAGTATATCSLPSSGAPTATPAASSTPLVGDLAFSGSALNTWECHFTLPHDWTAASAFDVRYTWRAASITGNVVWISKFGVVAAGSTLGGMSYSSATNVTSAAQGTTLQLQTAASTGITLTGGAADAEFFIQIGRNGGSGSDTMAGAAELLSVRIIIRRTITMGS